MESLQHFLTADVSGLIVQLFFVFTVVLMIFDRQKPPVLTGLLTGIGLIVLGLGGSFTTHAVAIASIVNGCLWLLLAWQRHRQR